MAKTNRYRKTAIASLSLAILLIIADQIVKLWTISVIKPIRTLVVIPGWLNCTYVENTGAAFGLFSGKTTALAVLSCAFLLAIVYAMFTDRVKNKFLIWTLALIVAGGFGNIIDRFARGFVVDLFDLQIGILRNFPVFNVADICVCVGAFLMLTYMMLFHKQLEPPSADELFDQEQKEEIS